MARPPVPTDAQARAPQPLFLVSPGRSGTTLLWRLLVGHPDLALSDEAGVFDLCWAFARWGAVDREGTAALDLERAVALPGLLRAGEPARLAEPLQRALRTLLLDYYAQRFPERDFLWFGEKMPNAEAARFGLSLFAGGRAFCLLRDPRDYVCSARAHARRPELRQSHPELDVSLEAHLERWAVLAEGAFEQLGPGAVLRYEDLLQAPREVAEAVLGELGLEPGGTPVSAEELEQQRQQHGTSGAGDGRGRYESELSSSELAQVVARLGPWMERLGYLRSPPDPELFSQRALQASDSQRAAARLRRREAQAAAVSAWWQRATGVLAAGTYSVSQGALRYPEGLYPLLAESGRGAWLRDRAGRRFVDWIMGFGPVLLGYRHPAVEAAMERELRRAPLLSLLSATEVELAEELRARVPGAEGVAFGKNGSDVLALAVRLARSATGRERVAVCGYHGFHDWYLASIPEVRGLPDSLRHSVVRFPYGDLPAIETLLNSSPGLAAVVLEPAGFHLPPVGYLETLAELCRAHGSVLVFDEVVTGLRLAPGGAQEAFGVRADLVCYGKALANGLALSALLGPERLLREIVHVGYGLTFRGERWALAAARASLVVQQECSVSQHVAAVGRDLQAGLAHAAQRRGLALELVGLPARLSFSCGALAGLPPLAWQTLFLQVCLEQGVLSNGSFLPSLAHGPAELAQTLAAFEKALDALAQARDQGHMDGLLRWPVPGLSRAPSAP